MWLPGVVQMMLTSCHTYSEEGIGSASRGCDETWDLRKGNSDVNIVVIVFTPMMWESDTEYHSLPTCSDKCLFCLSSPSVPENPSIHWYLISTVKKKRNNQFGCSTSPLLFLSMYIFDAGRLGTFTGAFILYLNHAVQYTN